MVTDTLIKKYTQSIDAALKVELTNDTISLIRKFDSRYKMQINQHFSLQQKYFQLLKFTKNQRLISHLFLEISSAWFCYEILILICTEYDSHNHIFLLKENNKKKGDEFLDKFLKKSGFRNMSKTIINQFYTNSITILDKISNQNKRTTFLSNANDTLNTLIQSNIKSGKKDYNFAIESFSKEISEIERISRANYRKAQKNREDFTCTHIDFKCFVGFCYVLRNQYVHNGLTYNQTSNNDKLFVEILQNINDSLNHLVLTLAVDIFKTIQKGRIENQLDEEKN